MSSSMITWKLVFMTREWWIMWRWREKKTPRVEGQMLCFHRCRSEWGRRVHVEVVGYKWREVPSLCLKPTSSQPPLLFLVIESHLFILLTPPSPSLQVSVSPHPPARPCPCPPVVLNSALHQHGGAVAPDLLPAGLTGGLVAGHPGHGPSSTPVWLSPGRCPLHGLWRQRILLQPQERRQPSSGWDVQSKTAVLKMQILYFKSPECKKVIKYTTLTYVETGVTTLFFKVILWFFCNVCVLNDSLG